MADLTATATAADRRDPRGPKPDARFSRANIMLYGTLIVVAIYYLLPLYVMIVTSLKGMPEIRARQHLRAARRDHLRALGQGLGRRPAPASTATASAAGSGTRSAS